jgi:hypothetical protein
LVVLPAGGEPDHGADRKAANGTMTEGKQLQLWHLGPSNSFAAQRRAAALNAAQQLGDSAAVFSAKQASEQFPRCRE